MAFTPKFAWFYRRFNRGLPDECISFWMSGSQNDHQDLGIDLDAAEDPVLSMIASPKNSAGWLTTKRFIWDSAEERPCDEIHFPGLCLARRPKPLYGDGQLLNGVTSTFVMFLRGNPQIHWMGPFA